MQSDNVLLFGGMQTYIQHSSWNTMDNNFLWIVFVHNFSVEGHFSNWPQVWHFATTSNHLSSTFALLVPVDSPALTQSTRRHAVDNPFYYHHDTGGHGGESRKEPPRTVIYLHPKGKTAYSVTGSFDTFLQPFVSSVVVRTTILY